LRLLLRAWMAATMSSFAGRNETVRAIRCHLFMGAYQTCAAGGLP